MPNTMAPKEERRKPCHAAAAGVAFWLMKANLIALLLACCDEDQPRQLSPV